MGFPKFNIYKNNEIKKMKLKYGEDIKKIEKKLKFIRFDEKLSIFSGHLLPVDTHCLIHALYAVQNIKTFKTIEDVIENNKSSRERMIDCLIGIFFPKILKYLKMGITPLFIFDGENVPKTKDRERKKRNKIMKNREEKLEDLVEKYMKKKQKNELYRNKELESKIIKLASQDNYIPRSDIEFIYKFLMNAGIPAIMADGEAEKMCSQLTIMGCIATLSSDSDCLFHGCPVQIFEEKGDRCTLIFLKELLEYTETDYRTFKEAGIATGCDHIEGIRGLSFENALRKAKKEKRIEKFSDESRVDCSEVDFDLVEFCRKYFDIDLPEIELSKIKCYKSSYDKINEELISNESISSFLKKYNKIIDKLKPPKFLKTRNPYTLVDPLFTPEELESESEESSNIADLDTIINKSRRKDDSEDDSISF